MKRTRWNHGATFKAQVALAAVKGDKTLTELAEHFRVHRPRSPNGSSNSWRAQPTRPAEPNRRRRPHLKILHAKIGQLALENDFLAGALSKAGLRSAKPSSTEPTHCPSAAMSDPQVVSIDRLLPADASVGDGAGTEAAD